jgi:hypothetical protein
MANWLQKILPPAPRPGQNRPNLPVNKRNGPPLSTQFGARRPSSQPPNASIIYGVAASGLFVIAVYFMLFGHRAFAGFLVLLLAICFFGFALHFLRFPK